MSIKDVLFTQPIPGRRSLSPTEKLDLYIDKIESIPPTPSLMVKLLAVFKQTNPDVDDVARLISRDPSITAEVLKLCNSAHYSSEKNVTDMFEAISRLGFYEIYRLVTLVSAKRTLTSQAVEKILQVEALCRHSMTTAVIAGVTVKITGDSADGVFIAGLLHDVGKIILASGEGSQYATVTKKFGNHGEQLIEAEKAHFGFDHAEVGSRLLERWMLPEEIFMAVRYHHDLSAAGGYAELAAIVALADILANHSGKKPVTEGSSAPKLNQALSVLNLKTEDIELILTQAKEEMKRDEGVMVKK